MIFCYAQGIASAPITHGRNTVAGPSNLRREVDIVQKSRILHHESASAGSIGYALQKSGAKVSFSPERP
jgi:hypothetical protein